MDYPPMDYPLMDYPLMDHPLVDYHISNLHLLHPHGGHLLAATADSLLLLNYQPVDHPLPELCISYPLKCLLITFALIPLDHPQLVPHHTKASRD